MDEVELEQKTIISSMYRCAHSPLPTFKIMSFSITCSCACLIPFTGGKKTLECSAGVL